MLALFASQIQSTRLTLGPFLAYNVNPQIILVDLIVYLKLKKRVLQDLGLFAFFSFLRVLLEFGSFSRTSLIWAFMVSFSTLLRSIEKKESQMTRIFFSFLTILYRRLSEISSGDGRSPNIFQFIAAVAHPADIPQKLKFCCIMRIFVRPGSLVWWQLWNFIVRQVKFSIFLHP